MKRATVVIGGNFGDEGKGLLVDFLAQKAASDTIVVRHNGGAQAGHTVRTPDGVRHVFHHFGSGTLAGAPSYLAPPFIANPLLFAEEWKELKGLGIEPTIAIDPACAVTTPFDMIVNQLLEIRRAEKHGSCGVGIGETEERSLYPMYRLTVGDFVTGAHVGIIKRIENEWLPFRFEQVANEPLMVLKKWLKPGLFGQRFLRPAAEMALHCSKVDLRTWQNVIFEGAQGLALDRGHHFFPHVTRSNTGLQNVIDLAAAHGIDHLDVLYVTRAYLTRHGAGPMPNECKQPYKGIVDDTNIDHPFQGQLRFGLLDIDFLAESISADFLINARDFKGHLTGGIAVTCLDQIGKRMRWICGGEEFTGGYDEMLTDLRSRTGLPVKYLSFGPTRQHVVTV